MAFPEEVEELVVADDGRVEVDLERLGVVAEVVVRGIRMGAARVADAGAVDAGDGPEPGVGGPESADGERGGLESGGPLEIDGRRRPRHGLNGCHGVLLRAVAAGEHDQEACKSPIEAGHITILTTKEAPRFPPTHQHGDEAPQKPRDKNSAKSNHKTPHL